AGAYPKLRTAAASLGIADWRERSVRWNGVMTRDERERIWILDTEETVSKNGEADPNASRLRRMLYFDQVGALPDNVLERADRMRGPGSLTRAYYEPKALDRAIDDQIAGKRDNQELLWTLLNLEIWHRQSRHA